MRSRRKGALCTPRSRIAMPAGAGASASSPVAASRAVEAGWKKRGESGVRRRHPPSITSAATSHGRRLLDVLKRRRRRGHVVPRWLEGQTRGWEALGVEEVRLDEADTGDAGRGELDPQVRRGELLARSRRPHPEAQTDERVDVHVGGDL